MKRSLISVVTPVFNESANIPEFYKQLAAAAKPLEYDFEVIFVDDGSTDDSVRVIERLKPAAVPVQLIELSRNFGKEVAISAGMQAASGRAVIMIDSDLQHPIACIPQFVRAWEQGAEVVVGIRNSDSEGSWIKHIGARTFYKVLRYISDTEIIPNSTDFRLLDRKVADAFLRFTERHRMTRGLVDWLGFRRSYIHFDMDKRENGKAGYSFRQLVTLAMNGFTSFSLLPLRLAGYIGVFFIIVFGLGGAATYIEKYIMHDPWRLNITGTAMLAMIMLFAIGIVLSCLGLVALYIENIYGEVINRPLYVIREKRRIAGD